MLFKTSLLSSFSLPGAIHCWILKWKLSGKIEASTRLPEMNTFLYGFHHRKINHIPTGKKKIFSDAYFYFKKSGKKDTEPVVKLELLMWIVFNISPLSLELINVQLIKWEISFSSFSVFSLAHGTWQIN